MARNNDDADAIRGPERGDGPYSGKGGPTSGAMEYVETTAAGVKPDTSADEPVENNAPDATPDADRPR